MTVCADDLLAAQALRMPVVSGAPGALSWDCDLNVVTVREVECCQGRVGNCEDGLRGGVGAIHIKY